MIYLDIMKLIVYDKMYLDGCSIRPRHVEDDKRLINLPQVQTHPISSIRGDQPDMYQPLSTMAPDHEDGKEEEKKRKKGGLKTMPFILGTDVFDRFATVGFSANLMTYLTQELHMPLVQAANSLTIFNGTSSFTPIIGGLIADSFAGRFWTLAAGSVIYLLGMLSLMVSAILRPLRPPPCAPPLPCKRASTWQLLILYASLLCSSIGSGGIRPVVVAFGADQYELRGGPAAAGKSSFFNLYFFSMGVAVVFALTGVVYVQENVGWGWGLGIPTAGMALSVVVLLIGHPLYVMVKPRGSPLTRVTQVVVAAIRKRNAVRPEDPDLLFEDRALDADISTAGRLLHTNQLRFLDRAAIVTEGDVLESGEPRPWRLSTVHRVEELKSLIRLIPVWAVMILQIAATATDHSLPIQQARTMDRRLSARFEIPPASLTIFSVTAMLATIAVYDRVVVPAARRVTGRPSGITHLQRLGVGFVITVFSNLSAALVETKRKKAAAEHELLDSPGAVVPISVFWLVPQYAFHGMAEAFTTVGMTEFLYDQAPESMRSIAGALYWLAISIGNYVGTILVTAVHGTTQKRGDWLQDNINRGKLDYFYWLVTGIQVFNLGYYIICATFYTFKPLETAESADPSKDHEDEAGAGGDIELIAAATR